LITSFARYEGRRICTLIAIAAASGALPSAALAGSPTHLKITQVKSIAFRAARPYVNTSGYPQGGPVQIQRIQLGHIGAKRVWLVRLHATLFVFKCAPNPTAPVNGTCPEAPSQYALVTISDAAGHVLRVNAATP
jgi:hypothetical protein